MNLNIAVTDDLETCFSLRHQVFVVEQGVPADMEQDALDDAATHLLAVQDGTPVGAARIVFNGDTAKIGRVCVLPSTRGTGLGAKLIEAAVETAQARPRTAKAKLGAQLHAIGFYEKLGFTAFGPVYDDAGIDHRDMVLDFT
ncbi:GNAT family N-acetyltransferase [Leisingera sp.]|uniref:GNAT family N-acetyltransferase n=1 Tax=Leisingera sp. TaxID=1879318 RepID=UPI002B26B5F5|nr:GNAT family N-acetyltransferase [Leisingera sp.]